MIIEYKPQYISYFYYSGNIHFSIFPEYQEKILAKRHPLRVTYGKKNLLFRYFHFSFNFSFDPHRSNIGQCQENDDIPVKLQCHPGIDPE